MFIANLCLVHILHDNVGGLVCVSEEHDRIITTAVSDRTAPRGHWPKHRSESGSGRTLRPEKREQSKRAINKNKLLKIKQN